MTILNMVTKGSGGGGNIGEPLNLTVTSSGADATITWEDNEIGTIPPTSFARSVLVRKVGSAPTSPSDGTTVVTETVKDTYKVSGYVDSGLTSGTTYYYRVFSYSDLGGISYCDAVSVTISTGWQPGIHTVGYYTMDNDILNHATTGSTFPNGTLNNAEFSDTHVHGNNTKSLHCNGSTYAYLPASSEFAFGTNDFTISCWVYSETNSGTHPGFICNYGGNGTFSDVARGYRISDRFSGVNKLNFCWAVADSGGTHVAWYDGTTNISIKDGWHNVVLTRNSGELKMYLDKVLVLTDTTYSSYEIGRNSNIQFGYNLVDRDYSKVYLNDVIFENVGWSAQNVADYYDLTV